MENFLAKNQFSISNALLLQKSEAVLHFFSKKKVLKPLRHKGFGVFCFIVTLFFQKIKKNIKNIVYMQIKKVLKSCVKVKQFSPGKWGANF